MTYPYNIRRKELGYTQKEVGILETYVRRFLSTPLPVVRAELEAFLSHLDYRRAHIPTTAPQKFILIHAARPVHQDMETYMVTRQGDVHGTYHWEYMDYNTHPDRHVQKFFRGVKTAYAIIVAHRQARWDDTKMSFAGWHLLYDWVLPIDWTLDLMQLERAMGPYSGLLAYPDFFNAPCVWCVRKTESSVPRFDSVGREPRYVQAHWLMHLTKPYAEGWWSHVREI